MIFAFGKRSIIRIISGNAFGDICRQIGMPRSAAVCQAGYDFASSSQEAWSGMVLPMVNSRSPVSFRPTQ
jgi:hypothetical protein